tara:strand:+ start:277 stop:540 length:264 start_codon:yes stop_codon:yes gene_type:complete
MSRERTLAIGITLSLLGFIIWMINANSTGPEAYEEMYWAFAGSLTALTGIVTIIVSLSWHRKIEDFDSNETVKTISIPAPVLFNEDA